MPHQLSNSSDDLLAEVMRGNPPSSWHFLRQLPVDFELAPQRAIAHVTQLQPDVVVCCGMAESRTQLSVESRAIFPNETLYTTVDLPRLVAGLTVTEISEDAGRFVCNALYYALLKQFRWQPEQQYPRQQYSERQCLFVHVPVLTDENGGAIASDFQQILKRLTT